MHGILVAIRTNTPTDSILFRILRLACEMTGAVHGSFVRIDQRTQELDIAATLGEDWTDHERQARNKVGDGIVGHVATTGETYLCSDTRTDPYYISLFNNVLSELAVPVKVGDAVWGVINLDGPEPNFFTLEAAASIEVFAELASSSIKLAREVEEQRKLQQTLSQHEKLAALGTILAGVAHELNNPLTAILGHASLLGMKDLDPASKRSLQAITSESQRAARLVKDLLGFSRKRTGQTETCNLNDITHETCALMRYQFKVRNARLNTILCETPLTVRIESSKYQQVLVNLVSNAEQALGESKVDGNVTVETLRKGELAIIRVQDNGSGIKPELLETIFEPFFTTKAEGKGTGLGLSMCREIIERAGGNISAQSTPGSGSIFTIVLPLVLHEALPPPQPALRSLPEKNLLPLTPPSQSRVRVLLVDDENLLLNAIAQYLLSIGFEVVTAESCSFALKKVAATTFDVVLTDVRLPVKNGFEFYEEACLVRPELRKRFVFMSGDLVRTNTRQQIEKTGCGSLEKPFSFQILKEILVRQIAVAESVEDQVDTPAQ